MTISGTSILADPPVGAHIVYPYTDEHNVVEAVSHYVAAGLKKGDGIVLVMTYEHCKRLEEVLLASGFDIPNLKKSGQLLCADAAQTLRAIMVGSEPDEKLFRSIVEGMIGQVRTSGGKLRRPVRAFGEMVSLLFVANVAAAIKLEELWNKIIKTEGICLLCTYALSGPQATLEGALCEAHSHYVA